MPAQPVARFWGLDRVLRHSALGASGGAAQPRRNHRTMTCVSDQGLGLIARSTAVAMMLCFGRAGVAPAIGSETPAADMPPAPISSQSGSNGEFDNNSALELGSGQIIKTDCSINWTSGDGKIYCFSTPEV